VDSQSVKTTGVGGEERGCDGGKKVKGRKRHLLVDTEGFVLKVRVHSAKVMDHEGIKPLLERAGKQFLRLSHSWLELGGEGFGMERGTDRTSAQTRPRRSADELGEGIGQGRQDSRLAEASATGGIPDPAASVGGGTLICLDLSKPKDEQGLREAVCERRSVRVRCHD
jgi:hypothetical protein